jgi:hypothetical protein
MERFELELVLVLVVDVEDEEVEDVDVDLSCHKHDPGQASQPGKHAHPAIVAGGCLYLTVWGENNYLNQYESIKSFHVFVYVFVYVFAVWCRTHK